MLTLGQPCRQYSDYKMQFTVITVYHCSRLSENSIYYYKLTIGWNILPPEGMVNGRETVSHLFLDDMFMFTSK